MLSKALLYTFFCLCLVSQNGCRAKGLSCEPRNAIPVTMTQLSENPWHVVAHVHNLPQERHQRCITTKYEFNSQNGGFINVVTSMAEGTNDAIITRISDVYNTTTAGVFDMRPRNNGEEVFIKASYLEFTPGESFIASHCEKHDGKIYTDRLSVAFKTTNVDPEMINRKLRSIGIEDFKELWLIPRVNCKN